MNSSRPPSQRSRCASRPRARGAAARRRRRARARSARHRARDRRSAAAARPTAARRGIRRGRVSAGPGARSRSRRCSRRSTLRRALARSDIGSSNSRMHTLSSAPRPTRPRSWCSCASPKRSACSITIIDGVGHVDADLDDRGRDQHVDFAAHERVHHRRLFARLHAPVQQPDLELGAATSVSSACSATAVCSSSFSDSSISGQTQ